jgi:hypothetical protein
MNVMIIQVIVGMAIMTSASTEKFGSESGRSFLMLNDQAIEFVDGAPVVGYWPVLHRWNEKEKRESEIIDGVEFVIGREFWNMVKDNAAKNSARSEVRVEKDGSLYYHGQPVALELGVGHLESVLRWHDWIVAVGTAADTTRATIKGPIVYLVWFSGKNLRGSYRQITSGVAPPLRIYGKQTPPR